MRTYCTYCGNLASTAWNTCRACAQPVGNGSQREQVRNQLAQVARSTARLIRRRRVSSAVFATLALLAAVPLMAAWASSESDAVAEPEPIETPPRVAPAFSEPLPPFVGAWQIQNVVDGSGDVTRFTVELGEDGSGFYGSGSGLAFYGKVEDREVIALFTLGEELGTFNWSRSATGRSMTGTFTTSSGVTGQSTAYLIEQV